LGAFENMELRRIYGTKRKRGRKEQEDGGNCKMRSFIICTLH
jgi:hypothetical protein